MKCSKCGCDESQIINEVKMTGKDFSVSKGCCGYILAGPIGILCGACGKGVQTKNTQYWVCNNCGRKWRA